MRRDQQPKVAVVTGASSGIGAAAARQLAARGYAVAVVGRSPERTRAVADEVGGTPYLADFASAASVRELAARLRDDLPRVDVLANNAGALFADRALTADGHERTWQVNVLAPALLTALLLPTLEATDAARVVFTASNAHARAALDPEDLEGRTRRYGMMAAYARAKLGTLLLATRLAARTRPETVAVAAFHPGFTTSEAFRDRPALRRLLHTRLGRAIGVSADDGARPLVHLATAPDAAAVHGAFYDRMTPKPQRHRQLADPRVAAAFDEAVATFSAGGRHSPGATPA
ncbi:SDR family NAD(P)-dependent oxidoreductase [Patulibacter sp. SYSU D01012]|uniref:SDR family NAD(P)-dependent oxidoreductase n=1 Tax=Patulibacter sp. SYSU D01012 TaxID=2817381 RepID=UPI001B3139F0